MSIKQVTFCYMHRHIFIPRAQLDMFYDSHGINMFKQNYKNHKKVATFKF